MRRVQASGVRKVVHLAAVESRTGVRIHLLQADYVGGEFANGCGDAVGIAPPVAADAAMNVVGDDPEMHSHFRAQAVDSGLVKCSASHLRNDKARAARTMAMTASHRMCLAAG